MHGLRDFFSGADHCLPWPTAGGRTSTVSRLDRIVTDMGGTIRILRITRHGSGVMMRPGKGSQPAPAGEMQMLVDDVPVPMIALGSDAVVAANDEAIRLFGGDVRGRSSEQVLTPEGYRQLGAAWRDARTARLDMALRRLDGTPFSAEAATQAVGDTHVVVLRETTSRRLREEELRQALADASSDMQARMRFFAGASHDLRQPLQAMALFLSALEGMTERPQAHNAIKSLKVSLTTMEEMFESLLGLARLDAGMLKAQPSVFMIGDVLEKVEDDSRAQAEQAGVILRVMPAAEAVCSDPGMLARILRGFVSNAIRYNDRGGKVLLGCRRRGTALRIEVWDNGSGIAEDRLEELIEEFHLGHVGEKQKGAGLGLAIAQRLARLLDHRLDVRSRHGRGSMFAIEVPLAETPAIEWEQP